MREHGGWWYAWIWIESITSQQFVTSPLKSTHGNTETIKADVKDALTLLRQVAKNTNPTGDKTEDELAAMSNFT